MQISLKGLLAIVAFCGGFFWCASWVGFDNGIFWFVFIASAIMSLLFVAVARTSGGYRAAWLIPLCGVGFCIFLAAGIASLALFANAVLLLIVAIVCAFFAKPLSTNKLFVCATACMLAAFVIGTLPGFGEMRRIEELRQQYPIMLLGNRLKYEEHRRPTNASQITFTSMVLKRLDEADQRLNEDDWSVHRLKDIHDR